jgi:hypothetical protein
MTEQLFTGSKWINRRSVWSLGKQLRYGDARTEKLRVIAASPWCGHAEPVFSLHRRAQRLTDMQQTPDGYLGCL